MSYINLMNDFWEIQEKFDLKPLTGYVYLYLLKKANSQFWNNEYYISIKEMEDKHISKPTFIQIKKELEAIDLIKFDKKQGGKGGTRYYITGNIFNSNEATVKNLTVKNNTSNEAVTGSDFNSNENSTVKNNTSNETQPYSNKTIQNNTNIKTNIQDLCETSSLPQEKEDLNLSNFSSSSEIPNNSNDSNSENLNERNTGDLSNENTKVDTIPNPQEKKAPQGKETRKTRVKKEKPTQPNPLYKKMVDFYFEWFKNAKGNPNEPNFEPAPNFYPKFGGSEGKALKGLISHFRQIHNNREIKPTQSEDDSIFAMFECVLKLYPIFSDFYKQCLKNLNQFYSQINNILDYARLAKASKPKSNSKFTEKPNEQFVADWYARKLAEREAERIAQAANN